MKKARILGTRIDVVGRDESLRLLFNWLNEGGKKGAKFVVTAYSEFYVAALSDGDFRMALEGADLVIPDGVGPLAAVRYQSSVGRIQNRELRKLLAGLRIGFDILKQGVGETVPGVWLFQQLVKVAAVKGDKVFLLGGYGDVAKRLTVKLQVEYPGLVIGYDPGAQNLGEMSGEFNEAVVERINQFKPDLLFVAYGPVKQEKWIATNRDNLKVKVAVGVGGTFDELGGEIRPAPDWLSRSGLKWFWRLVQEPKRIRRIWRAVVVFPWLVFRSATRGQT